MKRNSVAGNGCWYRFSAALALLRGLWLVITLLVGLGKAYGQGTLTFDEPWIYSSGVSYINYYEQGMRFRVVAPPPQFVADSMIRIGSLITVSHPHNGTPHMEFYRSYVTHSNYVVFSLTNGSTFGLTSVDLGNPYAYSLEPVISITFNGILGDGSMVSTTFTTPPDGTTNFHTFLFGPEFGSGLASVEIPSAVWAMDNLVIVPEPGTVSLLALGFLALAARAVKRRRAS